MKMVSAIVRFEKEHDVVLALEGAGFPADYVPWQKDNHRRRARGPQRLFHEDPAQAAPRPGRKSRR